VVNLVVYPPIAIGLAALAFAAKMRRRPSATF